jgi:multiple sugar transport system ATP-binding protein
MAGLTLRGAGKAYGAHTVIPGIDLDIRDGEFLVLVGPSGCGKSTLLRMIAGLEEISHGDLLIAGQRANDVAPAQRGIAMVFQSYALYPHMSVFENMAFGLKLSGMETPAVKDAVHRAAEALQITSLLERRPKDLSGGQRQRVAIGRAIVRKPQVFLFDEPLSNLDASLRVQMRVELARLHRELGTTMIYVTHDQAEAMTLGDRIVVLNGGHVEQVGTPQELYQRPANRFVAGFLGTPRMNFIERHVDGEKVTIGIRAEHLALADVSSADTVDDTVAHVEYLGDHVIVYTTGQLALRLSPAQAPAPGSAIRIAVPPAYCHVFGPDGRTRNIV